MPKKPYVYKKETTTGENSVGKLPYWAEIWRGYSGGNECKQVMCPYTNFIPVLYIVSPLYSYIPRDIGGLLKNYWSVKVNNKNKIERVNKQREGSLLTSFVYYDIDDITRRGSERVTRGRINEWLLADDAMSLDNMYNTGCYYSMDDVLSGFPQNITKRFSQRSYSGAISPYTIMRKKLTPGMPSGEYYPHVMAVVLPENYMYVKYHLLRYNSIPLDRVVVLIDKELDSTSFPVKPFRALYKKLLPHIMSTKCDVWKVPLEFIEENCFIDSSSVLPDNILDMEKATGALIDEFYEEFCNQEDVVDGTLEEAARVRRRGDSGGTLRIGTNGQPEWTREESTSGIESVGLGWLTWGAEPTTTNTFRWEITTNGEPPPRIVEELVSDTVEMDEAYEEADLDF